MSIQFNAKQTTLKIMLKLQFLIGKKYNEEWSTVKNCNFSKLQFFKCNFIVISLHIFAVHNVRESGCHRLIQRRRTRRVHRGTPRASQRPAGPEDNGTKPYNTAHQTTRSPAIMNLRHHPTHPSTPQGTLSGSTLSLSTPQKKRATRFEGIG